MNSAKRKKMKRILYFILGTLLIVALIVLFVNAPDIQENIQGETAYEDITYSTDPLDETLEFIPYFTMETEPETYPANELGDNVTVEESPADPNEVIDRTMEIDPSHPEYLDSDNYNPFYSSEGKVYRNNKVISIDLYDASLEKTFTVAFGYPTGVCNRFLYLNPVVTSDGDIDNYYIQFETVKGCGQVLTFSSTTDGDLGTCYIFQRAMERRTSANYESPQSPGSVWFTSSPLDRPVYIDAVIYNGTGRFTASVRLTVGKEEQDGTYSIIDLDSNNLFDQNALHPDFTPEELQYIVDATNKVLFEQNLASLDIQENDTQVTAEKCVIQIRPEEMGLLYDEFIPSFGGLRKEQNYINSGMDILAVTYRPTELSSHTLYFYIICPPINGDHGIYQYIGRDYPTFDTVENLTNAGWKQHP